MAKTGGTYRQQNNLKCFLTLNVDHLVFMTLKSQGGEYPVSSYVGKIANNLSHHSTSPIALVFEKKSQKKFDKFQICDPHSLKRPESVTFEGIKYFESFINDHTRVSRIAAI